MDSHGGQLTFIDEEHSARLNKAFSAAWRQLSVQEQRPTFHVLMPNVKPLKEEEGTVYLGVPNEFDRNWLKTRYTSKLAAALSNQLGQEVIVEFVVSREEDTPEDPLAPFVTHAVQPLANGKAEPMPKPNFNEKYTFQNFVTGQSNRLAHAGAKAVAENPGEKYNPLFIFGGIGLGKTHLLHSIGMTISTKIPEKRIIFIDGQTFLDEYVAAIRENRADKFRRRQRSIDVWLVDDVQYLGGKDKTQEEFFHTFNMLHQSGKQIVLCSDRPPKDLYQMDERLRSRFEQGLVADITAPDLETRVAILSKKAEIDGYDLPKDVLFYIADKIQSNVRTLEGALTRLVAQASLTSSPVTIDMAAVVLESFFIESKPSFNRLTVESVIKETGKQFNIKQDELIGNSRKGNVARARQIAMYILREHTDLSLKLIGRAFGNRDHTTVMHAINNIGELVANNAETEQAVKDITRRASYGGR